MTLFSQIELLPIAYFLVLMCVVCANVLAKVLGDRVVQMTTGPLHQILAVEVHIPLTGDTIGSRLFEQQLLEKINAELIFKLNIDFTRWMSGEKFKLLEIRAQGFTIQLYPQIYWSGCPPSAA
jgi:hypothetical protein